MSEEDPLVKIKNINAMAKHIGRDVARSKSIPISELKEYITPKEVKSIIQQFAIPDEESYLINTSLLQKIFYEVNQWVLGIELCKMASKGLLETSWDDEQNCMTFSAKDQNNG